MRINAKRGSLKFVLGLSFAGLFILSACSTSATPEPTKPVEVQQPQLQEESPTQAPTDTALATSAVTDDGYPAPSPDQGSEQGTQEEGYPAPESQVQMPDDQIGGYPSPGEGNPPPVKTELLATDPSTVDLESGELQLVEFFAFW